MSRSYTATVLEHWAEIKRLLINAGGPTPLNGTNLALSLVVVVARHGAQITSHGNTLAALDHNNEVLQQSISKGDVIYGVNTGFGGSANTRTNNVNDLQRGLLREFNSGILLPCSNQSQVDQSFEPVNGEAREASVKHALSKALATQDLESVNCMPVTWVRAAMAIRVNSLLGGYSGVRSPLVEQIYQLLGNDIVPRIPVFGSISASGDLSPLSYIGNTVQGSPNVSCIVGSLVGSPRIVDARIALAEAGMKPQPVIFKEGLAIMNGTAMSAAVGGLALHDAHGLSVLGQILTAMSVESLRGTAESFDPLFAKVRPHPGQIDSSRSIFGFLAGSKLLRDQESDDACTLKQDRYAVRTAAQWIGPVLEDLLLAHQQITIECNSVTDNPLIEVQPNDEYHHFHGGNFQARAVTSAMDKTRQGLQSIGRMLFSQCTEIINPATNFGLPPNLVADEPSESFMFKSIDIMIAALLSELGFLANPVGSHVQTAEMGNQALNSLALISARYTINAIDVLSKLVAAHLLVTCQALDLRVMDKLFFEALKQKVNNLAGIWHSTTGPYQGLDAGDFYIEPLSKQLLSHIRAEYENTTTKDSLARFHAIATSLQPILIAQVAETNRRSPDNKASADIPTAIADWTLKASSELYNTFHDTRKAYLRHPTPEPYLGSASKALYTYIRGELGVPFLTTAVLTGSGAEEAPQTQKEGVDCECAADTGEKQLPSVGAYVTRIYAKVRSGEAYVPAFQCLQETYQEACGADEAAANGKV